MSRISKALCWIALGLYAIASRIDRPRRAVRFIPKFGPFSDVTGPGSPCRHQSHHPLRGDLMAAVSMNTLQEFTITIAPVNAKGQPAPLDGVPEWLTDNGDVVTLSPSADGLSCLVKATGIPGTGVNVQVTGDADMGTGISPIKGILDVDVTAAPATTIVMTPSTPSDQP